MTSDESIDLRQWIAAELDRDDARAEPLFRRIVPGLPRASAPPGTADRIGAALGWPEGRSWRLVRWAAWMVAGLVGVTMVVGGVPVVGSFLVARVVELLNLSAQGFVWLVQAFEGGLDVWGVTATAGRAFGGLMSSPEVVAGFVAFELIGVGALYAMHRLLSAGKGERE